MKTKNHQKILFGLLIFGVLILCSTNINAQTKRHTENKNMRQILIDRFIVPLEAKEIFFERMKINRQFIRKIPGFVEDSVYEMTDKKNGEMKIVTIAVWENEEVLKNAKTEVGKFYEREKFDMPEFLEKHNIQIERAIYQKL